MSPGTRVLSSWCLRGPSTDHLADLKVHICRTHSSSMLKNAMAQSFHYFFLPKYFLQLKKLQSWTHYKCTFNCCVNFGVQIRSFYWRVNKKKKIHKATIRASCPEKVPFSPFFPSFSFSGDQRERNWGRILEVWSVLCYLSACLSVITVILELVTS